MSSSIQDLQGKTYVVTGANSGIGYAAALDFARRGASLALVCRSEERGQVALAAIEKDSGNKALKLYLADFNSLAQVDNLSQQLLADYPTIDVLCNNAGGANAARVETSDGFETTFVANHLASFLLTQQLMPSLLKAAEPGLARVVFTSSYGHKNSALDFDDLNLKSGYNTLKAYGRSKLMNLLTAREIHRRFGEQNIVASSYHPGGVRTSIWSKGGMLARVLGFVFYPFMVSIDAGADTLIWLASSDDKASLAAQGNYFYKRKQPSIAEFATDEAAQRLWDKSEGLVRPFVK